MSLKNISLPEWVEWGAVLAVFLVALGIRAYDLGALAAFPDELTYISRAVHILGLNGGWSPSDMWDQPPLFTYVLAAVIGTVGGNLDSLRLVSVFAGSVTVVLAYLLGRSMYGKVAGFVAASALAVDGFDVLYSRLLYIEALALMLILAATLFFYEGLVKRRDLKMTLVGAVFFGLALDAKYISLVMAVALVFFLVVYRNKLVAGFPKREVLIFFGVGVAVLIPVLAALAAANVDPFYYDLVERFQVNKITAVAGQLRSGVFFIAGYERFIQAFIHISSTNPFGVYPPISIEIPIWTILVSVVLLFFLGSFLMRRNPADGLLFILLLAFLGFALTYPAKRNYFALYPSLMFFIMMGRVTQLAVDYFRSREGKEEGYRIAALLMVFLTVSAVALNALSVPDMYQNGFGDWDEIYPIMTYIGQNSGNNTLVATTLAEFGFYIDLLGINASVTSLKQASALYQEPIANYTTMTPVKGEYPIYWVISPAAIEKENPQFIVMPKDDYVSTTAAFQQYVNQNYYQPLNTKLILLFQIKP